MNRLGAAALAFTLSLLSGCATSHDNRRQVYIETWDDNDVYARISQLPLAGTDLVIAFAEPTAGGGLTPPAVPDGLKTVIDRLDPEAGIALAVGGWGGTDADHRNILQGFATAAGNPAAFAAQVADTARQTGTELGRPVTGVDLDWEYPTASQAQGFAGIVAAIKKAMPGARITVAAPSDHDLAGIEAALPAVKDTVDGFNIMTYDEHTPFDGPGSSAGPVATEQGMVSVFQQWQARLASAGIDPGKAALGVPTYLLLRVHRGHRGRPTDPGRISDTVRPDRRRRTAVATRRLEFRRRQRRVDDLPHPR